MRITHTSEKRQSSAVQAIVILAASFMMILPSFVSAQCPGATVNDPMPISCKMAAAELCVSTATPNNSYLWSTSNGSISGDPEAECIIAETAGDYSVLVTNNDSGCTEVVNVAVVEDFSEPVADIIEPPSVVLECNQPFNQMTVFAEAESGIWEINWRFIEGGAEDWFITAGQHDETVTFTSGNNGSSAILLVEVIGMNACATTDTIMLFADCGSSQVPCPDSSIIEPMPISCKMASSDLCATTTAVSPSYSWSTDDGAISGDPNSRCVVATEPGNYQVIISDADTGCIQVIDVTVVEDMSAPTCEIVLPGPNVLECNTPFNTATVIPQADSGVWEINWRFVQGGSEDWFITDGQHEETVTFTSGNDGTTAILEVEIVAMNGCKTTCQVTLIADCVQSQIPCPESSIVEPTPISCKMPTSELCATTLAANPTFLWTTTDGSIGGDVNAQCVTALTTGTYQVTITDSSSDCISILETTVTGDFTPPTCEIILPGSDVLECNDAFNTATVIPEADSGVWEINWRFIEGGAEDWYITAGQHEETVTFTSGNDETTAILEVEIIAMNGCKTTCRVTLFADCGSLENPCLSSTINEPTTITCDNPESLLCVTSPVEGLSYQWSTVDGSFTGDPSGACISATSAGTYAVIVSDVQSGCLEVLDVIVSEDLTEPTCEIVPPAVDPEANSSGNALTVVAVGATSYSWQVSGGAGWNIDSGANTDSITYTTGNPGATGTFEVTVTADNGCVAACSIQITVPDDVEPEPTVLCSFTQGFWGNKNGLALMTNLLSTDTLVIGLPGRSITVGSDGVICLNSLMPMGGTPAPLPSGLGDVVLDADCDVNFSTSNANNGNRGRGMDKARRRGQTGNVLVGQTVALSLNVMVNPELCDVELCEFIVTQDTELNGSDVVASPGADRLRGTDDDPIKAYWIPEDVLIALTNLNLPRSVCGVLELANRALGGDTDLGGATYSEINAAATAINEGFDECKMLIECVNGDDLPFSGDDSNDSTHKGKKKK